MSDGFIRLFLVAGTYTFDLAQFGLTWPPPERIILIEDGQLREATDEDNPAFVLHRTSMSQLTDEQIATMSHVMRGAEYHYAE